MAAINANINASVGWVPLSEADALALEGGLYTIGSETIEVGGPHRTRTDRTASPFNGRWVSRGLFGSTAASHLSGATLTRYYPEAPGGGGSGIPNPFTEDVDADGFRVTNAGDPAGAQDLVTASAMTDYVASELAAAVGGFDYTQAADPGAVGEGKLWLQTPPVPAPLTWTSGFEYTYADHGPVQPTVPNDHVYLPTGPFVGTQEAGVSEPTWPTDGSTVVDNEITWQDEGLIEEFFDALAEEPFRTLWRRNAADDGWTPVGYGPAFGGDTSFDLSQYYPTGVLATQIGVEFGSLSVAVKDKRGRRRGGLTMGTTDLELAIYDAGGAYLYSIKFNANDGGINIIGLPSVDPDVAGALFTDGAPTAGVPQALMVSGGPA